ncbi:hypothetical protein EDO6_05501 [Paenibacillus xylanexedens]|nr:hypothetical protein EDO6_05501 [Paenibacillus xylanexedens]
MIWLYNPNNLTGPFSRLLGLLNHIPSHVVIVLDEAYYESAESQDQYSHSF